MKTKILMALAVFATTLTAAAQTTETSATTVAPAKISSLGHDKTRIRQGVKSGELTRRETAALATQRSRVAMERKDYKQDGTISPLERKDLRKDKRQLSRNIYRQKHDAQVRH